MADYENQNEMKDDFPYIALFDKTKKKKKMKSVPQDLAEEEQGFDKRGVRHFLDFSNSTRSQLYYLALSSALNYSPISSLREKSLELEAKDLSILFQCLRCEGWGLD